MKKSSLSCYRPQHFLYFLPLPQGQGSLRPIFCLCACWDGVLPVISAIWRSISKRSSSLGMLSIAKMPCRSSSASIVPSVRALRILGPKPSDRSIHAPDTNSVRCKGIGQDAKERCDFDPLDLALSKSSDAGAGGERNAEPGVGREHDGLPSWMDSVRSKWADGTWETGIPRIATGVPDRTLRLKCLGNAVVPAQFYPIFKAIHDIERRNDL